MLAEDWPHQAQDSDSLAQPDLLVRFSEGSLRLTLAQVSLPPWKADLAPVGGDLVSGGQVEVRGGQEEGTEEGG